MKGMDMCFYMSIIKDNESSSVATPPTSRDTAVDMEVKNNLPTSDVNQSSDVTQSSDGDQSSDHSDDTVLPREQRSTSLEIGSFVPPYIGVSPKCHLLKTKKSLCCLQLTRVNIGVLIE